MVNDCLLNIKLIQTKIEKALKDSNFEKLGHLSAELETKVENLANDPDFKVTITQEELVDLKNLLLSIKTYQKETSAKFKDYSLEVSQKRKMHQAYKR